MLYQLSYLGIRRRPWAVARRGRLYSQPDGACPAFLRNKFEEIFSGLAAVVVPVLFVLHGRNRVAAGKPAVQVHIGAALGAEGPVLRHLGFSADRALALEGLRLVLVGGIHAASCPRGLQAALSQ